MSKMLMGKAALTAVRLTDGTRANIAAGRAVPASIDPDDAARLLAEGFLEEIEIFDPVEDLMVAAGDDDLTVDVGKLLKGNVGDILDTVGDDAVLAAAALEAEQATSKPRATLVEGLQETIDAAAGQQPPAPGA